MSQQIVRTLPQSAQVQILNLVYLVDILRARIRTIGVEEHRFRIETGTRFYQPFFFDYSDRKRPRARSGNRKIGIFYH